MPAFLDEHGQQLWHAYMTTRHQASAAKLELKQATQAMRRTCQPGKSPNPAITSRYQTARDATDEADRARRDAERAYHAYRRVLLVRSLKHLQPRSASERVIASTD